jgi:integrase
MPQKSTETVHILEGQATLFKRPGTPHWHIRYKANGKWERTSTKCSDLAEAKQKGADIAINARFREQHGLPVISKRISSVARLTVRRLQELINSGTGNATAKSYNTYIQAINNYIIPFLGNHNIDRLDSSSLARFDRQRMDKMGRLPSASVINNHNAALSQVFDEALRRGYINKFQIPLLRNDGRKSQRRPDFGVDDYKTLYRAMRSWVLEGREGHERRARGVLREYVLVLANTGIRAGTEGMNLKWRHIGFVEQNGRQYLTLMVNGKTGEREVIARHSVATYLDRLRRAQGDVGGSFSEFLDKRLDQYVFRIDNHDMSDAFGRMFGRLLKSIGLHIDPRTERPRTLYSLRHFYATMALTNDRMSVYTLAKHLGTSVLMIERHYEHMLLRQKAGQIAGWDGRK